MGLLRRLGHLWGDHGSGRISVLVDSDVDAKLNLWGAVFDLILNAGSVHGFGDDLGSQETVKAKWNFWRHLGSPKLQNVFFWRPNGPLEDTWGTQDSQMEPTGSILVANGLKLEPFGDTFRINVEAKIDTWGALGRTMGAHQAKCSFVRRL